MCWVYACMVMFVYLGIVYYMDCMMGSYDCMCVYLTYPTAWSVKKFRLTAFSQCATGLLGWCGVDSRAGIHLNVLDICRSFKQSSFSTNYCSVRSKFNNVHTNLCSKDRGAVIITRTVRSCSHRLWIWRGQSVPPAIMTMVEEAPECTKASGLSHKLHISCSTYSSTPVMSHLGDTVSKQKKVNA